VVVRNESPDVPGAVLVDGHEVTHLGPGDCVSMRLGEQHSLLASLPEATFFRRYRATFGYP
jgi:hypothetical protein